MIRKFTVSPRRTSAVTARDLSSLETTASNCGSMRVLEKAGYVREGHLRQSAIKDGTIRDQLLFAAYRRR